MSNILRGLKILESDANKPTLTIPMYHALVARARQTGRQQTVEVMVPGKTAEVLLEKYNTSNRSISKVNVASLVRDMENNRWVGHVGDEVTIAEDGQLNNGQHRMYAIRETGIAQPMKLCFGMTKAARASEGSGRSKNGADLIAFKEGAKAKNKEARSAALRLVYGFIHDQSRPKVYAGNRKPTHSEFYDIEEQYGESISESLQFVMQHDVQTITVVSNAAFLHFLLKNSKYGKKYADSFFEKLGTGVNLKSTDPVMVARNRFIRDAQGQKALRHQSNKDVALGLIVKAWNATVEGKNWTSKERNPDMMMPIKGLTHLDNYILYSNNSMVNDMFS